MNLSYYDRYQTPLSLRYASQEMSFIFSQSFRYSTFRKLWIALAKAEKKLGINISSNQIKQMESHIEDIDFTKVLEYEKQTKHDVMAHIHAFAHQCPEARSIIHLGATSCFVTDNTDLIQIKKALQLIENKLAFILAEFAKVAQQYNKLPCMGYTHLQPAQPTTVGKRICLWLQDFFMDLQDLKENKNKLPFLGAKGATGTQASFLALFDGDEKKVKQLDEILIKEFEFEKTIPISGQTYTRKLDIKILNTLQSFAASSHKFATDIRLLSSFKEINEGFEEKQVGSSAMPYKKNPILCERVCGLSRFLIALAQNPPYTAATQWLERSLDDSANRRLCIAESFLCCDSILNLLYKIIKNIKIDEKTVKENIEKNMHFISMENILMEAVKRGGDRQLLHEKLKFFSFNQSFEETIQSIDKDKDFHLSIDKLKSLTNIQNYTGLASKQVTSFLEKEVFPLLKKYQKNKTQIPNIQL